METIDIPRPSTAPPPITEPLQAHIPNARSTSQAREMLRTPEIRYQRLQQGYGAFDGHERTSADAPITVTVPTGMEEQALGRPHWSRQLITPILSLFSRPSTVKRPRHQAEYDRAKEDTLEDFKQGIPRLGALLGSSNSDFGLWRGYFAYSSRILLQRQIELGKLAKQLDKLDAEEEARHPNKYMLRTVDLEHERHRPRIELLEKMETKIGEYYDFLLKYREVRNLAKPTKYRQRHVHNWMIGNRPLREEEADFINHISDLVITESYGSQGEKGSRLEAIIDEYALANPGSWIDRLLYAKVGSNGKSHVFRYQKSRSVIATRIVTVILAAGSLLAPVFLLFLVSMSRVGMALTVFGFVISFAIMLCLVTEARAQEVFIGTAAYGAFLVTFLGSMNQGFAPGVQSVIV